MEFAFGVALTSIACLKVHELAHAGGWPAWHPDAIYTKECGTTPMPPHKFPVRGRVILHYGTPEELCAHCGCGFACSPIGVVNPEIWLPKR